MNVLVDMNLATAWATALSGDGIQARHWQDIGERTAPDHEILAWARTHDHVVLTLDLDFQQLLFATRARGPSVVLLRVRDPLAGSLPAKVRQTLIENAASLQEGSLIVIDENRSRIRRLPLTP